MASNEKLFAFKVASKEQEVGSEGDDGKWAAREGVSAAGCTDYRFPGNVRYPHPSLGTDRGVYC